MSELQLDGSNWKTTDDFYDAFFLAVGAPSWHGRNFNALRDSIITGQINKIELPYTIHISGLGNLQGVARSLALPLPGEVRPAGVPGSVSALRYSRVCCS